MAAGKFFKTRIYDRLDFTLDKLKWYRENPGTLMVELQLLRRLLFIKYDKASK